jgi:hypothetical protein
MANDMETTTSPAPSGAAPAWVKWGVVAAASALAGGLATAWWYKTTLERLRQPQESGANPQYGISEEDRADEI